MRVYLGVLSGGCLAMALTLAILATTRIKHKTDPVVPEPTGLMASVQATPSEIAVGAVAAHAEQPFQVVVRNNGLRPARLLGAPTLCTKVGCMVVTDVSITIPPGQTTSIPFRFWAYNPGFIHETGRLLFDVENGQVVDIPYSITGQVVDETSSL